MVHLEKQQFEDTFNDYPESASNNAAAKAIKYKEEIMQTVAQELVGQEQDN